MLDLEDGQLLILDDDKFSNVTISGDVTIDKNGITKINNNKITLNMLDANLISNTDQIIDFDANEEILVSDNNQYKNEIKFVKT